MTIDAVSLKEKIDRADRVALVIPRHANEETYLAALALAEKIGEKVFLVGGEETLKYRWHSLFPRPEEPKKEFTITINTTDHPIDSLKYETQNNQLKIFLHPQTPLAPEHFQFEEAYPRSSLVLTLGFHSQEQEERILHDFPLEQDGEIISLTVSQEKMGLAPLKLLARIMLRARPEPSPTAVGPVMWSFISREDFAKTDTTSPYIPPLLPLWQDLMPPTRFTIFLWQEKETEQIGGLVSSPDEHALMRFAHALGTQPASDYFIIPPLFTNFTEAEFKIRRLLKEAAA
jgi:hypothetical protein